MANSNHDALFDRLMKSSDESNERLKRYQATYAAKHWGAAIGLLCGTTLLLSKITMPEIFGPLPYAAAISEALTSGQTFLAIAVPGFLSAMCNSFNAQGAGEMTLDDFEGKSNPSLWSAMKEKVMEGLGLREGASAKQDQVAERAAQPDKPARRIKPA